MNPDNPENNIRRISAESQQQVMDWSLVLASQVIEATILNDETGWALIVEESDYEKAAQAIALYQAENRFWRWRQRLPGSNLIFHWGSLLWCLGIIWIYFWSQDGALELAGVMDSQAVRAGKWWRVFTAITLHGDLTHLAANVTIGFLLIGLAMARYGGGIGLLASYLAGAGGNLAGFLFYDATHRGLGASGMVMGALGLLAAQDLSGWKKSRRAAHIIFQGLAAGVSMLILMGTAPGTDVLAHVGGFVCGVILGVVLNLLPSNQSFQQVANKVCVILLPAWVIFTWWLARGSGF